jgi:uncharacterized MAPEG superfamily protein
MHMSILAPAAVLVLWSLVMLFWLAFSRLAAVKAAGIDMAGGPPGGRGQDLDPNLPPQAAWKSHNYAHLMEQPTIFYPTVVILFLTGAADQTAVFAAWGYVLLRIAHSLYQATVNIVRIRFLLFMLSSLCLLYLAIMAVLATL